MAIPKKGGGLMIANQETEALEQEIAIAVMNDRPERPVWRVDSLSRAGHAMLRVAKAKEALRALAEARGEFVAEIEAAKQEAMEPIDDWYQRSCAPLTATVEFFEGHLKAYALERRAEDPKNQKSTPTPWGKVATYQGRRSTDVVDEERLINDIDMYLPANVAGIVIRRHVAKSELLSVCEVHREVTFSVGRSVSPAPGVEFATSYIGTVILEDGVKLEAGDPWPDAGTGEMLTVGQVISERLVLCWRADADTFEDGTVGGGTLVELGGVTVTEGPVTADVKVGS